GAPGFLAILSGVSEIRDHRGDPPGRSASEAVREDQQFHDVLIHRITGGEHHETVTPPNILFGADDDLAVREDVRASLTERHIQMLADLLSERDLVATGEDLHPECVVPGHDQFPSRSAPARRSRMIRSTSASC